MRRRGKQRLDDRPKVVGKQRLCHPKPTKNGCVSSSKSRGHFRAGFDDIFPDDRIIEVDVPGLTTVVLDRVPWREVQRPIYPLDKEMGWTPPRPEDVPVRGG